jgi:hypothetical protein
MASAFSRCALAAIALVAAAWLALGVRAVELESEGRAVLRQAQSGPITPEELSRGRDLLRRAGRFSADKGPLVNESLLLATAGRREKAAAIAERVVEDEPGNLEGWIVLYLATHDSREAPRAPERGARALRMVRALNPLAADALR